MYSFGNQEDLFKFAREGSWKSNSFEKGGNLTNPLKALKTRAYRRKNNNNNNNNQEYKLS